jgi:hypothetical protein
MELAADKVSSRKRLGLLSQSDIDMGYVSLF